jgi:hypothetical protein
MNMEAATAPGRAYAAAFQKLGDIASDTLEKFREKKEEKDREDNFERLAKKLPSEVFSAFGVQSEEEKLDFIKSIKKKGPREDAMAVMSFFQKAQDAQEASRIRDLQMAQIRQNMERQTSADQLAGEELMAENQFLQTLPSLITSPQAQRQADIARPGLPALGNADARNRFMQAQLENPRNQVPVMNLNDRDFLNQFKDDPQQIKRALAFIEKRKASQPKPMSDKELEELLKLRLANQKALKESGLPVLTEGEQVIDELTAKEYSEYVNLGGKSAVQSKIKKLNKAIQDLEGSDDLNSWLTGVLPESMKALFNEKGLSVQQAVESVIQENLRETLGAQFAQKEGEMFMARGYDDRLSDEVNIERVKSLLKEIEDRASARTQTFDYFKKNKTMKGYDGPVFNESSQPSPSSSFDPQEIDRLYEEKMRLGKARGLR